MNVQVQKSQAGYVDQQHEVFLVYDEARGADDDTILQKAWDENWILITNDKDFGEKVYREHHPHHGIIFLRLTDDRSVNKIAVLHRLIELYADKLSDQFLVASESRVRFAKT